MSSPTTIIRLPVPLHAQFKALAEARGVGMVDLIQRQVREAVEAGEIPFVVPGYACVRLDHDCIVQVAGYDLPDLPNQKATLVATVFLAVAGQPDPVLGFEMPRGRPVTIELDERSALAVNRIGRGVRFVLKDKQTGSSNVFSAPPVLVAELGREILRKIKSNERQ